MTEDQKLPPRNVTRTKLALQQQELDWLYRMMDTDLRNLDDELRYLIRKEAARRGYIETWKDTP